MKFSTRLATLALVLGTSAPAFAQVNVDAGGGVNAGGEVSVGGNGVNAGGGANAGSNLNVSEDNDLLSSLNAAVESNSVITVLLRDFNEDDEVRIVLVSQLNAAADASLKRLMEARSAMNKDLSGSVSANAALVAKLKAKGHDADDVVAVTGDADGSLTLFIED